MIFIIRGCGLWSLEKFATCSYLEGQNPVPFIYMYSIFVGQDTFSLKFLS